MNITIFTSLFIIFSIITGICTEGCKKILKDMNIFYSANILAFVVACIVGSVGTGVYYILYAIEFNIANIICMIVMGVSTAFGSMVGYDKIMQTIEQIRVFFKI